MVFQRKEPLFNILICKGKLRLAGCLRGKNIKYQATTFGTPVMIKKAKSLIMTENLTTKKATALKLEILSTSASKMIHKGLECKNA